MSTDCVYPQQQSHHVIPNRPTYPGAANISTCYKAENQEPTSIDFPNPNMRTLQNSLGEHGAYPVYVARQKGAAKALPSPDFYQRQTRRPWDIQTTQFARAINKRLSWSFAVVLTGVAVIGPLAPKMDPSVDTGKSLLGFGPNTGIAVPGPTPNHAYAGN